MPTNFFRVYRSCLVILCATWIPHATVQADYAATVLESGPVAYYRFEEPEGAAEIADSSGNDHPGIEVVDVEFQRDGVAGSRAAEFFGFSSIVLDLLMDPADPEGNGIGVGNDDFTIETWVYPTGVGDDELIRPNMVYVAQKDGNGLGRSDMLVTANRQLGSFIGGGTNDFADPSTSDPLEVEQWYHFVMTVDGTDGEIYFYLNGELSELSPHFPNNGIESADGEWVIGSHKTQGTQFFTGLLDEIAFYDFRLDDPNGDNNTSDSRILTHYEAAFDSPGTLGDFDGDGQLTAADIDALTSAVRTGSTDSAFDLSGNGTVDDADRTVWVEQLKNTYFGDANLDGEFNSGDLVFVFTAGEYEDGVAGNSTWATGDWDGDGDFGSGDFVKAFTAGGYESGPRAAVATVPEPATFGMLLFAATALALLRPTNRR